MRSTTASDSLFRFEPEGWSSIAVASAKTQVSVAAAAPAVPFGWAEDEGTSAAVAGRVAAGANGDAEGGLLVPSEGDRD